MPDDGLHAHERALIHAALAGVPKLQRAVLYGSRALGTWRRGSDVDLALEGDNLTNDDLIACAGRLDDLPLPYRYDLTLRATIANPALAEHITQHGVTFWERGAENHGPSASHPA